MENFIFKNSNLNKVTQNNLAYITSLNLSIKDGIQNSRVRGQNVFPDLLKNMRFPSITYSLLGSLYKSVELEKDMRKELIKKGLSTINTLSSAAVSSSARSKKARSVALHSQNNQSCAALKKKVQKVQKYKENLIKSEHNDLSEINSYVIKQNMLIEQKLIESQSITAHSNEVIEKNQITTSNNEETEKKEENVKYPAFFYCYPNISLNESKEGIIKKPMINCNKYKYILNLTSFDAGIASNKSIAFKFVEKKGIPINNLYKFLVASLNPTKVLISQPYINESANKIDINVFYFAALRKNTKGEINVKKNLLKNIDPSYIIKNKNRLNLLCANLSQIFKKRLNLVLTRLYDITSESQILATSMGSLTKKVRFNKIKSRLLKGLEIVNPNRIIDKTLFNYNSLYNNKNINPANLSGVSVKVAGRLITEKVVPRKTVRSFQIGSLARSKANIVTKDRYTKKNKRGCFSVTIQTGHFINKDS